MDMNNKLASILLKDPRTNRELVQRLAARGFVGAEGGLMVSADATRVVPGTNTTVDGQPLGEIWNELQSRLATFNQNISYILSLFTFPVTRATEKVAIPANAKFEEATELGRPQKVRLAYVTRGFPLTHRDLAYGYTQEFIDSARGQEIQSIRVTVENAWNNLLFSESLKAIFTETNATEEDGVSVKRLYNADGEVPPAWKFTTHAGTHTHYLTSAGASFDAVDLAAMEEHLIHHGYGATGEQLVLLLNRAEVVVARTLTGFVPAASSNRPSIITGPVIGAQGSAPAGLEVQGYIGRWVIVELDDIPPGYMLGISTGGSLSGQNIVGYRRHENPSIQGLRLIEGPRQNYPIVDSVYDGYAGFGIRHRGGAVVMQLTAGAYATPTVL
jgi:hypothetical protein